MRLGFTYIHCCCCVASVVSDSVRPHRWQPTRLHRPWDSPGKNTGVGCHFLLQCVKVKSESEVAQSRRHGLQPTRLLHPCDTTVYKIVNWNFPGCPVVKNLPSKAGYSDSTPIQATKLPHCNY